MRILQSLLLCKTQLGCGADSWMPIRVFRDCGRSEVFSSSREQTWSWSHYLCIALIPICGSFAWVKCQSLWHLAQLVEWYTMTIWCTLIWIFFSIQYSISRFATCPLASLWTLKASFSMSGLESSLTRSLLVKEQLIGGWEQRWRGSQLEKEAGISEHSFTTKAHASTPCLCMIQLPD